MGSVNAQVFDTVDGLLAALKGGELEAKKGASQVYGFLSKDGARPLIALIGFKNIKGAENVTLGRNNDGAIFKDGVELPLLDISHWGQTGNDPVVNFKAQYFLNMSSDNIQKIIEYATLTHQGSPVSIFLDGNNVKVVSSGGFITTWAEEVGIPFYHQMAENEGVLVQNGVTVFLPMLWAKYWASKRDGVLVWSDNGPTTQEFKWELIQYKNNLTEQAASPLKHVKPGKAKIAGKMVVKGDSEIRRGMLVMVKQADVDTMMFNFLRVTSYKDVNSIQAQRVGDMWAFRIAPSKEVDLASLSPLTGLTGVIVAPFMGYLHLYAPTGAEMVPQVRREKIAELFDNKKLRVLLPTASGDINEYQIKNDGWDDLMRTVIYNSAYKATKAEAEVLSQASIFNINSLWANVASKRVTIAELEREAEAQRLRKKREEEAEKEAERRRAAQGNRTPSTPREPSAKAPSVKVEVQVPDTVKKPKKTDGPLAHAGESHQVVLDRGFEKEALINPDSIEAWLNLARSKAGLGRALDAESCVAEATWRWFQQGRPSTWGDQVMRARDMYIQKSNTAQDLLGKALNFAEAVSTKEDMSKLMSLTSSFKEAERTANRKLRWMFWSEIVKRTKDTRLQEEIRESLLMDLMSKGITAPMEMPGFLRERILKDPDIEFNADADSTDDDNEIALVYINANIQALETRLRRLKAEHLRICSLMTIARIYAQIGNYDKTQEIVVELLNFIASYYNREDMDKGLGWEVAIGNYIRKINSGSNTKFERWFAWTLLCATYATMNVFKDLNDSVTKLYTEVRTSRMLDEASPTVLDQAKESFEVRRKRDNVVEYIMNSSREVLGSDSKLPENHRKLIARVRDAKSLDASTRAQVIRESVKVCSELVSPQSDNPALSSASIFLKALEDAIKTAKWDGTKDTAEALQEFEALTDVMNPQPADSKSTKFYFYVTRATSFRTLLDIGKETKAVEKLCAMVGSFGADAEKPLNPVDLVDITLREILPSIEMFPRQSRIALLEHYMDSFLKWEANRDAKVGGGTHLNMTYMTGELTKTIDGIAEAAINSDRLVLRRLRDFDEREEASLRRTLLSASFAN